MFAPLFAIALQSTEDVLTFGEVLAGIPHDAAAFAVYLMLGASLFVIWKANRGKKPRV